MKGKRAIGKINPKIIPPPPLLGIIRNEKGNTCTSEEADARLVWQAINCAENGFSRVVVRTVVTDVILLLVGNVPYMNELGHSEIHAMLGLGIGSLSYYNIRQISLELCGNFNKALTFQYVFTGCDTTSSFYSVGKCRWFDFWLKSSGKDVLTSVFLDGDAMEGYTSCYGLRHKNGMKIL